MKTKKLHVFICVLLLFVVLAGCGQPVSSETASLASSAVSEAALSSVAVSSVAVSSVAVSSVAVSKAAVSKAAVSSAAAIPSSKVVSAASLAASSQTVSLDTWNEKGYRVTELTEPIKTGGASFSAFSYDEERIMQCTDAIVRCEVIGGPKNYLIEYTDMYGPNKAILQQYQIRLDKVLYSDGILKDGDSINVIGGSMMFFPNTDDIVASDGYPKLYSGKKMYIFLRSITSSSSSEDKKKKITYAEAHYAVAHYSVGEWYSSIDILGDNEYQYDCDAFPFFEEWAQVTQPRTFVGYASLMKVRHSNFDGLILQLVEKHKDIIATR